MPTRDDSHSSRLPNRLDLGTGWIWILAGFGENPAGVPAFSHAPRFGFGAPIIGALEHPVDWRVSFEAEDAKSIPGHGP